VHAHSLAGVALEAEHNLLGGLSLLKHARRGFGQRLGVLPGPTGDTARFGVGTPGSRICQGGEIARESPRATQPRQAGPARPAPQPNPRKNMQRFPWP
jgi:hypothetical protein